MINDNSILSFLGWIIDAILFIFLLCWVWSIHDNGKKTVAQNNAVLKRLRLINDNFVLQQRGETLMTTAEFDAEEKERKRKNKKTPLQSFLFGNKSED